jgi:hypothetical protein
MDTAMNSRRIALASQLLGAALGVLTNLLQHTVGTEYVAMGLDMVTKAFEYLDRIHRETPPPLHPLADGGHDEDPESLVMKRRTDMVNMAILLQELLQSIEGGSANAP